MSRNIEQEKVEFSSNPDVVIFGRGPVGEKARQLIAKTSLLQTLGFRTPQRVVLAEGFFDDFFQRNGLGNNLRSVNINEETERRIRRGSLTPQQFLTLQKISQFYGNTPLVIRSSAEGDARGTGTYKSVFVENQIKRVRKGFQKVLASYFSKDAIAFRQDANTGEGFGVIIEPLIGYDFEGFYAPLLSGFACTSTSRGEGYLTVVPGLGCGVESSNGERITKSQIEKFGGSLDLYIEEERDKMINGEKAMRRSALLQTDELHSAFNYSARAFMPSTRHSPAGVYDTSLEYPQEMFELIDNLDLSSFFAAMEKMELAWGSPQYLEWVMTSESGKPIFWIVQIADVSKKLDLMDFGDFGKVVFIGHTVTGTGIKEPSKIVVCYNYDDIERLNRFNQNNENYVLVYSSRLTSRYKRKNFTYNDFSNASVFIEIQETMHAEDPVAHLEGQLDMTGKLFGVLDTEAEVKPDWEIFDKGKKTENDLEVYCGKIKVIASERQNRICVYVQDVPGT